MAVKRNESVKMRRERARVRQDRQKAQTLSLVVGGALVLAAIFWILFDKSNAQSVVPPRMGSAFGDFALVDIHGKTVRLSDYKGQVVLVNAWATWCPPCKAEMPLLNQYYQVHAGQGFVLLAVNAGDSLDQAAAFAGQNHLAFPVLLDPGTKLLDQMAIHDFPTSILIGKDGTVKAIHIGMFTSESIESEVTPLLGS
jgi:thiol-disulfide isomerase/thioredoxin